ncbi:MAG: hypothetical protein IT255_09885 [Chitinophagaceae bacterium]|nr:hypothetical protein [Chitinophagaceae bacterium]
MKKKNDFKKSCLKQLNIKELHGKLGDLLLKEKANRGLDAREANEYKKKLLPSSAVPFMI